MKNKKQICLLDWDGTLRDGFTIVDWMIFLNEKRIISTEYVDKIRDLFKYYNDGRLSHDSLAVETSQVYAESIVGIEVNFLNKIASEYIIIDEARIFSFVRPLLNELREREVDLYVISGAPIEVLRAYGSSMHLDIIHGLEIASADGHYTNTPLVNPGISSQKKKIVELYRDKFLFAAFGNSVSDIPLFEASEKSVCINFHSHIDCKHCLKIDGNKASYRDIMLFLFTDGD